MQIFIVTLIIAAKYWKQLKSSTQIHIVGEEVSVFVPVFYSVTCQTVTCLQDGNNNPSLSCIQLNKLVFIHPVQYYNKKE